MIPKQIVRRGLSDGADRLRGQFREASQRGEASEDSGERIENTAAAASAFTGRNAAKLLKRSERGTRHGSAPDAAISEQREAFADEVLPDAPLPQGRTGSTRIKTREVSVSAVDGDTVIRVPNSSPPRQMPESKQTPLSVKTKDTTPQAHDIRQPAQPVPQADRAAPSIRVREAASPRPDMPPHEVPSVKAPDRVPIKTREAVSRIVATEERHAAPVVPGEIQRFDKTSLRIKTREAVAEAAFPVDTISPPPGTSRLTEKWKVNLLKPFQRKGHEAPRDEAIRQDLSIGQEANVTPALPFPPASTNAVPPAPDRLVVKTREAYIQRQSPGFFDQPSAQPVSQRQLTFMRKRLRKTEKKQAESSQKKVKSEGKIPSPSPRKQPGVAEIREQYAERRPVQHADMPSGQAVRKAASKEKTVVKTGTSTMKGTSGTVPHASRAVGRPAKQAVKTADKMAAAPAKALQAVPTAQRQAVRAAQTARALPKTVAAAVQAVARAAELTAKTTVAAAGRLAAVIAAGGGVAAVIVLVLCLAGVLIASPFGLFFGGSDSGSDYTIPKAVAELNGAFTSQIEQIQEDHPHDTLDLDHDGTAAMLSNWSNVLAVYAVRVGMGDVLSGGVAEMTAENLSVLRETFWAMNQVSYVLETVEFTETDEATGDESTSTETILHISVSTKDCWQMADEYGFTEEQKEMLAELLNPEYQELFQALTGSSQSLTLSPQEVLDILEHLPDDLSAERRQVILTAYQLFGKVNYFWGGKSLVLGWDSRWGTPAEVWAAGSPSTGTVRPYGLDCSGFVDWVFYNVSGGAYVIGHGGGAASQHSYCTDISWEEVIPGDLVFYPGDSHVGIVCGFDESGGVRIIHCASGSHNNVVVTGKSGFVTAGRPRYYSE